jgi:uncharacterized protein (TIGR02302 family)
MAESDMKTAHDHASDGLTRRLRRTRFGARISMTAERLLPLLLPLASVLLLYAVLAWFGVLRAVPDVARIAILVALAALALTSLWPLRRFRHPGTKEIDRRLERDNALVHAPISAISDRLTGAPDARAQALWEAHKRRLADKIGAIDGVRNRTDLPERDPYALRAVLPIVAVIAFAFSFGPNGGSLADAVRTAQPAPATPMRVDAWITPPAYTGIAPIFLTSAINAQKAHFTVPEGSVAKIRLAGGNGDETALFAGEEMPLAEDQSTAETGTARAFEHAMPDNGTLEIRAGGDTVNAWTIAVTPDDAPVINFAEEETRFLRAANGTWTINYYATDDYRLRAAEGRIELARTQDDDTDPLYGAPELQLVLPRRSADNGAAKTSRDLTEHPWAGARIRLTLEAEDDPGQLGVSETVETILPGRPFSNRLARAIIEQRRLLALDANHVPELLNVLDTLTLYPEETIDNASHFLGLTTARARLASADTDDALRDVVDYLWEIARQIEDGNLSEAERRLRQAQQALRDALENGASDEEIEQLMAQLRQAMQDYMSELAEQMRRNPQAAQQMPNENMQELDRQSLEDMLDQIEEMAKSGARDQAMDMLSQLEDMMNNLQMGQGQRQQGQQGQNQAQQQMNELGEILRQQQELMNETFRQNRNGNQQGEQQPGQGQQGQDGQRQPGQGQQGQGQPGQNQQGQGQQGQNQQGQGQQGQNQQGQGQGGRGQNGLPGLAPGQQALQQRLDEFMQGLRDMGVDPGDSFGRAGESMDGAGEALRDGEGEAALAQQGDALDALREGASDMMQQMQQQAQNGQGSAQPGGNRGADDRDPLGRPQRSSGPDFGESVDVPDEIDVRRAREILEAIRERLGDALSPQLEKEYLERLLDLN